MVATSATSVVEPTIIVSAFSAGAISTAFYLTSGDVRVCGAASTRDGDVLWFLVLYHDNYCSTDNWMYSLLHLADKTSSAIDVVALLDSMFVLVWF